MSVSQLAEGSESIRGFIICEWTDEKKKDRIATALSNEVIFNSIEKLVDSSIVFKLYAF